MISRSPLAKEERFPRSVGAAQTHTVRTAKCNTTLMYTCTWRQIPVFTQCCSSVRIEKRSSCHSKASVQWWHKHRTSLWLSAACLTFYSVCKRASQIRTLGGSNAAFLKHACNSDLSRRSTRRERELLLIGRQSFWCPSSSTDRHLLAHSMKKRTTKELDCCFLMSK